MERLELLTMINWCSNRALHTFSLANYCFLLLPEVSFCSMPCLQVNKDPVFLAMFNMGRISGCMARERMETKFCFLNLGFSQDAGVTPV